MGRGLPMRLEQAKLPAELSLPSKPKSRLLSPPAASEKEDRLSTLLREELSKLYLLQPDIASLNEERRKTPLLLLLPHSLPHPLTTPLLRMMVNSGDSTPVSAADEAQDASPCAPGTLLMASARILLALLMLPRQPAAALAAAPAAPLACWPSRPRQAMARTMLHELLLLYALLAPWLPAATHGLPQKLGRRESWLKRCLSLLLNCRLG